MSPNPRNASAGRSPAYQTLRKRVEHLARALLGGFETAQDLWRLEIDLLGLQRDIQTAISSIKQTRAQAKSRHEELAALRETLWHARHLGDAFAWVLLGLDRKTIHPLTNNECVPVPQDDHGSRGVITIASHLANEGWGFPVLHDLTDCLRIGDITFVRPGEQSSNRCHTVEVKTRLVSEGPTSAEQTHYEYDVTVLSPVPRDAAEGTEAQAIRGSRSSEHPVLTSPPDPRWSRQLARISKAITHQRAEDGTVVEIEDEHPLISTRFTSRSASHWKTLRRVIRKSRASGYASEAVDGAALYTAFYHPEGRSEEMVKRASLPEDLVSSGLLPSWDKNRNAIVVYAVPAIDSSTPTSTIPYYLYDLPKRAIFEMLHGHLTIFILINPGRIMSALEEAGFDVYLNPADNLSLTSIVVSTKLEDQFGHAYRVEFRNLLWHIHEVVYEFRSIEHLVEVARSMRNASLLAIEQAQGAA